MYHTTLNNATFGLEIHQGLESRLGGKAWWILLHERRCV